MKYFLQLVELKSPRFEGTGNREQGTGRREYGIKNYHNSFI
ncbi:hypothetical protein [Moorena sp. SIO3H5]|nr:hypothetical protein [Moorena sp. SIO3H5]